jgi:hypothetical protein
VGESKKSCPRGLAFGANDLSFIPNLVMRYILTCCVCLSAKLILCFIFSLVYSEIKVFGTNSSASELLLRG